MMDESLEVPLHLQGAVPVFKGKHGPPVKPEIGTEHLIVKYIFNRLVVEILILREEELHDLHAAFLAQPEFSVCVGIFPAVFCCTAEGIVRIMFI